MEIHVKINAAAKMEITLKPSDVPCVPFTSRILWVKMANVEGEALDWRVWVNNHVIRHNYEVFVFSATGQAMASGNVKAMAKRMELDPIITMKGINNDRGCLRLGTYMFANAELDPEGRFQGDEVSYMNSASTYGVWKASGLATRGLKFGCFMVTCMVNASVWRDN